jgi:hypothetical protein
MTSTNTIKRTRNKEAWLQGSRNKVGVNITPYTNMASSGIISCLNFRIGK